MSAPGWYPDPANPGEYRYWDGTKWRDEDPIEQPPKRSWAWLVAVVATVAVLVAMFLLMGPATSITAPLPVDTNSAKPTGPQWDENPSEPPSPIEQLDQGELIDCPNSSTESRSQISSDGRVHGGGLSFAALPTDSWNMGDMPMPWVYDLNSQSRQIEPGWMSDLVVGELHTDEGFTGPRMAAESMISCLATSSYYLGYSGREYIRNQAIEIDGHAGWRSTANVYVADRPGIKGDVVDVVVLDIGVPGKLSVFTSAATIDDTQNLAEAASAFDSLRVD